MNCEETRSYIDTFVDGELDPALMIGVEGHLRGCETCHARSRLADRSRQALRDLPREAASDLLRRKVERIVDGSHQRRRRLLFAAAPLAAAAGLLIAVALPGLGGGDEALAAVVDDVVERHVRELPMEVSTDDPQQASSWFRGKVDFPVRAPSFRMQQASFRGARLSNVRADPAAHMSYDVDSHRVSLMIFHPRSPVRLEGGQLVEVGGRQVLVGRRNGYNVAVLLEGDMAYALSSDLPRGRLLELAAGLDR